jgi:hypothetical protein
MRSWLVDIGIGIAIAAAVVFIALFAAFNSTFVYRGF